MRIEEFDGHGPRARREFWAKVAAIVNASEKKAGKNVSVDEYPGKGTVINVHRERGGSGPPPPGTGACCLPKVQMCVPDVTEEDCLGNGGIWFEGADCDPNPCTGACCNLGDFTCTGDVSKIDCEASGGIYLGNSTVCGETTCTCCPHLDPYTTITFSGEVLGCAGGTITLPAIVFTKAISLPGCNLDYPNWWNGTDCGCAFQAQNCYPFTEAGSIQIDETGGCADPFAFGTDAVLLAEIYCNNGEANAYLQLAGSTSVAACGGAQDITFHGPYAISGLPYTLDVTYASDSDPSISFHYMITFA